MKPLVRIPFLTEEAAAHVRPANYLLVKLAARCNLKCTYCYWFRDATVNERPAVLTPEAEDALLYKLERHITTYGLSSFYILFHGGEPTLIGKRRFRALCERLRALESRLAIQLRLSMTSNGLLLDEEWIDVVCRNRVGVTLSLDGPAPIN